MKRNPTRWIYPFAIMGMFMMLNGGCKKDNNNNPTITDIDGNVYHTKTIGTQVWMVENLKTTRYNDGSSIPLVSDSLAWINLSTPGFCWYNNDVTHKDKYGALYNWFAVNTGKLAPAGWHIPSDDEWNTLIESLGGQTVAGGKMKETGTVYWTKPNTGAGNSSGFSALPGGYRNNQAHYGYIGNDCALWSGTENIVTLAWERHLFTYSAEAYRYSSAKESGFSVRCLKD
jgi:uncharacterized protein (TIGR02145 family)